MRKKPRSSSTVKDSAERALFVTFRDEELNDQIGLARYKVESLEKLLENLQLPEGYSNCVVLWKEKIQDKEVSLQNYLQEIRNHVAKLQQYHEACGKMISDESSTSEDFAKLQGNYGEYWRSMEETNQVFYADYAPTSNEEKRSPFEKFIDASKLELSALKVYKVLFDDLVVSVSSACARGDLVLASKNISEMQALKDEHFPTSPSINAALLAQQQELSQAKLEQQKIAKEKFDACCRSLNAFHARAEKFNEEYQALVQTRDQSLELAVQKLADEDKKEVKVGFKERYQISVTKRKEDLDSPLSKEEQSSLEEILKEMLEKKEVSANSKSQESKATSSDPIEELVEKAEAINDWLSTVKDNCDRASRDLTYIESVSRDNGDPSLQGIVSQLKQKTEVATQIVREIESSCQEDSGQFGKKLEAIPAEVEKRQSKPNEILDELEKSTRQNAAQDNISQFDVEKTYLDLEKNREQEALEKAALKQKTLQQEASMQKELRKLELKGTLKVYERLYQDLLEVLNINKSEYWADQVLDGGGDTAVGFGKVPNGVARMVAKKRTYLQDALPEDVEKREAYMLAYVQACIGVAKEKERQITIENCCCPFFAKSRTADVREFYRTLSKFNSNDLRALESLSTLYQDWRQFKNKVTCNQVLNENRAQAEIARPEMG